MSSTTHVFTRLAKDPHADIISAALGASSAAPYGENDIGKGVKLGTAQNYVPVADGDEIEGFVVSLEPFTVNDGFSFGSVQRNGRVHAEVGASQVGNIAVGALVVADVPVALGTAGALKVKTGTPATYKWRVLRIISGTGATGSTVLIERV